MIYSIICIIGLAGVDFKQITFSLAKLVSRDYHPFNFNLDKLILSENEFNVVSK